MSGYFGLFECIEDYAIASALFQKIETFLKENGMKYILGPMNLSTNHECCLLIKGFDLPPAVMMPYNFPYYQELIEKYGFTKAKDLIAYFVDFSKVDESIFEKIKEKANKKDLKVRKIRINDPEEIKRIKEFDGIYKMLRKRNIVKDLFAMPSECLKRIYVDTSISEEEKKNILGENIERLLRSARLPAFRSSY